MALIREDFEISKEDEKKFSYVGLEIEQLDNELILDQIAYIKELKEIEFDKKADTYEKLSEELSKRLRSLIGQLAWVAGQTRPDIFFDVCQLSVNFCKATLVDVKKANKCVKRVKMEEVRMCFPDIGDLSKAKLIVYADASFNNLGNGGSQGVTSAFYWEKTINKSYCHANRKNCKGL